MPARRLVINGREQIDPRHTRAWRTLVAQVVAEEPYCWLQLEGCAGASTTGDHVIPVTVQPELAMERANVRGACWPCNDKRGNLPIEELNLGGPDAPRPAALSVFD
jgi:5-methylcytosine-specific restriction endonuclease McrA